MTKSRVTVLVIGQLHAEESEPWRRLYHGVHHKDVNAETMSAVWVIHFFVDDKKLSLTGVRRRAHIDNIQ